MLESGGEEVIEYDRDGNVNTAEFWDAAWRRTPEDGANKDGVRREVLRRLEALPAARVWEYGFGGLHLARALGADRWHGVDHSKVAVAAAKDEGFIAEVGRCADSPGFVKSYLVALEVLEHLDANEMVAFLEASRRAPHAFFSVPGPRIPDKHFGQHMRGWDGPEDLEQFLRQWWPHVEVTPVDAYLLAHCRKVPPAREPILTVGCSTLLDFHGFLYTAASWMTHHGTFDGRVEYLLADNHPEPTARLRGCPECSRLKTPGERCASCAKAVEDMEALADQNGVRYIRWAEKQGTYPGKNRLKVEARGKWVLTMDSHVLLSPATIERCIEWIEENPESDDFHHIPCLFRTQKGVACAIDFRRQDYIYRNRSGSKQFPVYGWTRQAETAGDPYPIAAMITSCYLVRRDAWFSAKGYDPILGNYGGWEGPIQLKWWLMGRRVLSMRHSRQEIIDRTGWLHHWHLFCKPGTRMANQTGRVHTGPSKMRNFAASSAVIGGEAFVRQHCAWKGWDFNRPEIQAGMAEGLKLRPWMVSKLARPEWEDIFEFFRWMRDEKIPGAMTEWS